jgi:hypothetical protein
MRQHQVAAAPVTAIYSDIYSDRSGLILAIG